MRGLNGDGVSRACGFVTASGSGSWYDGPTFSYATAPTLYGGGGNGGIIRVNGKTDTDGTPGKMGIIYFRLHY